jgi:hypothetical protein
MSQKNPMIAAEIAQQTRNPTVSVLSQRVNSQSDRGNIFK